MIETIRVTDIRPGGDRSSAIYEFTCDKQEDIAKLPTVHTMTRPYNNTYPRAGSSCIYTNTAESKIQLVLLCADNQWRMV